MSRSTERAWVAGIAILATLIANAAWLHGLLGDAGAGPLTGIHTLNSEDTPTYYAWIDQARHGAWRFRQLYTPEPNEAVLFNPLFLLAGWLATVLDLSNAAAFHLTRVLLGLLAVPAIHFFLRAFLATAAERFVALLVVLFAGGIGWLWVWFGADPGSWPIDLWVPESSAFMSLVESPLNLVELILWSLLGPVLLKLLRGGSLPTHLGCFALAALLVSVRPYAAAVLSAVAIGGAVLSAVVGNSSGSKALAAALTPLLGVALGILPAFLALSSGPVLSGWGSRSVVAAPGVVALLAGLAGPLALAVPGIRPLLRRRTLPALWILLWLGVVLVLLYSPVGPQVAFARKMLAGVVLPLGVLAGAGVGYWIRGDTPRRGMRLALATGIFAASLPSNLVLLDRDQRAFAKGGLPYRLSPCLAVGFETLESLGTRQDVVLAPPTLGLLVPALTGHPVVCCHRDQTLDPRTKEAEVLAFYRRGPAARAELLDRYDVRWVLVGGGRSIPRDLENRLEPIHESACLQILAVEGDDPSALSGTLSERAVGPEIPGGP